MIARMSLPALTFTLMIATAPVAAVAQGASPHTEELEPPSASQRANNLQTKTDAGTVVAALRLSSEYAALLAPPPIDLQTGEEPRHEHENMPTAPVAEGKGSAAGMGFMIGGAAAFVGGLIIGGTGGHIIAAGGVGLAVYGIIIYF